MDNLILYILITLAIAFGLTMLALIDIIKKDFVDVKTKIIWHFVALIPLVGCPVYFLFGAKKRKKK